MIYTITLNPAIDKIIYLKQDLQLEQNNKVEKKYIDLGGKATHVSAILSQLGTENCATGFYGSLNEGELEAVFEKYNINHEFIEIPDQLTRESTVVVNHSGGSYMITEDGLDIDEAAKKQLFEKVSSKVKADDIVVIAGTPPKKFSTEDLRTLIKILKTNQSYIAIDLSNEYLNAAIEEKVDFIKPNEHEINELITSTAALKEKFRSLAVHVNDALCSLGKNGVLFEYENKLYQAIPPEVELRSDTGAGDAFVAGYIYALSQGYEKLDRVRYGIMTSASKVQQFSSCTIDVQDFSYIDQNIQIIEVS